MISSFTIVLSIVVRFTFLTKRIPLFPGQALTVDGCSFDRKPSANPTWRRGLEAHITSSGYPETAWSKGRVVGNFADLISSQGRSLSWFSRKIAVDHIEGEVALAKDMAAAWQPEMKLEELPVSTMVLLNPELLCDFG